MKLETVLLKLLLLAPELKEQVKLEIVLLKLLLLELKLMETMWRELLWKVELFEEDSC